MSKRVYEIAKELDMTSKELVERIAELGLDLSVQTSLSTMSEEDAQRVKQALQRPVEVPSEEKPLSGGVVRRRSRKVIGADGSVDVQRDAAAPHDEPAAPAAPVAPVAQADEAPTQAADDGASARRQRSTIVTRSVERPQEPPAAPVAVVETPVAAPVSDAEADAAQRGVTRRRFVTTRTRPAEDLEPRAAAAPEVATPTAVEAPADTAPAAIGPERRSRFATRVTRSDEDLAPAAAADVAAAPPAAEESAAVAPQRRRFATIERPQDDAPRQRHVPINLGEIVAATEIEAPAPRTGGARIVGTVDPELLSARPEARRPAGAPGAADDSKDRKGRGKKGRRVVQSGELYKEFNQKRGNKRKGARSTGQGTRITTAAEHKRVVRMEETILVSELAHQMGVKGGEIVAKLAFELGIRGVMINSPIDFDTAALIATNYNFKVEQVGFDISDYLPAYDNSEETLVSRPPVVTVMGHVDHGKTSLLDAMRDSGVSATEAGGITQHIGAYKVEIDGHEVCFLDTPGHEAFTALRARGASATDIVVLVVAADDGVMPQTVEAINHAREAGVPIIVAVNKVDKPGANVDRVKQALTEYNLVAEEWGGDTMFVLVSALKRTGITELVEAINLQAEVLELRANPNRQADGLVIESRLDVGRGPVATMLVQGGTLKVGDILVTGQHYGRVRTMSDEWGRLLDAAPPSTPVEVTGLSGVPSSGEHFYVVKDEKGARSIAEHVATQHKQTELAQSVTSGSRGISRLDEMMRGGESKELKAIVKGDVQGSVEAINQSLLKMATPEVSVRVIHSAVGSITESDVNLAASASDAGSVVIIGFNVRPEHRSLSLAEQHGVRILTHSIIYEMLDEVKLMMSGLLDPIFEEEVLGHAEVRKTFQISKVGTVAGCMVLDGIMRRNARVRVLRDSVIVSDTVLTSLKHETRDEREMRAGFECGISIDRFNDIKVGDILECYTTHQRAATI